MPLRSAWILCGNSKVYCGLFEKPFVRPKVKQWVRKLGKCAGIHSRRTASFARWHDQFVNPHIPLEAPQTIDQKWREVGKSVIVSSTGVLLCSYIMQKCLEHHDVWKLRIFQNIFIASRLTFCWFSTFIDRFLEPFYTVEVLSVNVFDPDDFLNRKWIFQRSILNDEPPCRTRVCRLLFRLH